MMQATDFGKRHDPAHLRPFDGPDVRRILVERSEAGRIVEVPQVGGLHHCYMRQAA
jgi:hypothetical protein